MSNYHYLVASLPMLFFGDPPPFAAAELRRLSETLLGPEDGRSLALVLEGRGAEASAASARAWADIETQFRNAIAHTRAAAYGIDPRAYQRMHAGYSVAVQQAVEDAFAKPTPLEREQELDRARWRMLDDLALTEPFGLANVIAFAVKLQISESWAARSAATGQEHLESLITELTQSHRPHDAH
jgi:hypothetical protein